MATKAKREPDHKREREYDVKGRKLHMFGDVGPPIPEPDYKPRIHGNPEETLKAAFISMKRDYGGPLPADFMLHAVLKSATVTPDPSSSRNISFTSVRRCFFDTIEGPDADGSSS